MAARHRTFLTFHSAHAMKQTLPFLVFCLALFAACSSKPDAEGIRKDVRAVMDAQAKAWNAGDIDGYMDGYLKSDTTRFVSGANVTVGWKTIAARMKKGYPDRAAMGTLRFYDVEITPLSDDAAFVFGKWMLSLESGRPWGSYTLLFRNTDAGWKIVLDHTDAAKK